MAFVAHWLLHPSMYNAVPDLSQPPGCQAAMRAMAEAQKAILREARDALYGREPPRAPGEGSIDLDAEERLATYLAEHERVLEAEERAHQDYMKYLEHLAEGRGQTLDQYLALQEVEVLDPEAEA